MAQHAMRDRCNLQEVEIQSTCDCTTSRIMMPLIIYFKGQHRFVPDGIFINHVANIISRDLRYIDPYL